MGALELRDSILQYGATNVKDDIVKATKRLVFAEEYQKDDIEPEYRKIIV